MRAAPFPAFGRSPASDSLPAAGCSSGFGGQHLSFSRASLSRVIAADAVRKLRWRPLSFITESMLRRLIAKVAAVSID